MAVVDAVQMTVRVGQFLGVRDHRVQVLDGVPEQLDDVLAAVSISARILLRDLIVVGCLG